jgi:hypothetical protein
MGGEVARLHNRVGYPGDKIGVSRLSSFGKIRLKARSMINLDYPHLLDAFTQHLDPKRSESASFLIWYLEQYYHLDTLEAVVDSVCDQKGDRGVDGIFVNDNDQTITVFQARISQRIDRTVGDASLREFAGTLTQFQNKASLLALSTSAGNADVAALIKNLDLINKIDTHEVTGEYLTNIDLDANGEAFLLGCSNRGLSRCPS